MKLTCIFHQNQTPEQKNGVFQGISSFTLHIIAMLLMLCDHLWADYPFPIRLAHLGGQACLSYLCLYAGGGLFPHSQL